VKSEKDFTVEGSIKQCEELESTRVRSTSEELEIVASIYKEFKSERVDTLSFMVEPALIRPM